MEIAKIEAFCKDEPMFEAVRKILLQTLYMHGVVEKGKPVDPLTNGAFNLVSLAIENPMTDEVLGQHLRGMWSGINSLQVAYDALPLIKSESENIPSDFNNAI